jgi:hypothetical protein
MKSESIYFFNSEVAIEASKTDSDGNKIFFYNDQEVPDAPYNCISVPINRFYDYFFKTDNSQISQINFDGTNFSDEIKNDIKQSIV